MAPELPPGFVVRTEAQKAAAENGFQIGGTVDGPWLRFASTTVAGHIWLAGTPPQGPWLISLDHAGVAAELRPSFQAAAIEGPGLATFTVPSVSSLHSALERLYRLSVSLPDAPLVRFERATAALPRSTEAERLVIMRVGQGIFRDALMKYWNGRCPLTGIADPALLRASHIVPWAESDDAARLDVHNGLLLAAHWDAAFDAGLVSFTDAGEPIVSAALSPEGRAVLRLDLSPAVAGLTPAHRRNLAVHRQRVVTVGHIA